jgi:hypothetical protein
MNAYRIGLLALTACGSLPLSSGPDAPVASVTISDTPATAPGYDAGPDAGPCSYGPPQDFLILLDLTGPNQDQGDGEDGSTAAYFPFVTEALVAWLDTVPPGAPYRFSVAIMALPDGGQAGLGLPWSPAMVTATYVASLAPNPSALTDNEPAASWDALVQACEGDFATWGAADGGATRNVMLFTHDDGESAGGQSEGTVIQACSGIWTTYTVGECVTGPWENLYVFSDASGYGFDNPGTGWITQDLGLLQSSHVMALELDLILDCGG